MPGYCDAVIVWINGAFGAGKTTLAQALQERLSDAVVFDPELVGGLLRQWVPGRVADFQDIPLWRRMTVEFAAGLYREYGRLMIVPMTIVNPGYRDEIFGMLAGAGIDILHVFLDVPAPELRRRIDSQVLVPDDPAGDADARRFRLANLDRCVAARTSVPPGTVVLRGDQFTPDQLADWVLAAMATR